MFTPAASSTNIDFAVRFEMITDEEFEEIMKGDMVIEGNYLTNLNAATVNQPTGTQVKLYPGRKIDVMVDSLFSVEPDKDG
jgi:hypothetical protein